MQIELTPETQARLDQLVHDTGRPAQELVEAALASYLDDVAQVRDVLDRRYADLKQGRVAAITSDAAIAGIQDKSRARRAERPS